MHVLAATGALTGHLGLGGAALALTLAGLWGTRPKKGTAIKPPVGFAIGACAGTCYAAAGEPWSFVPDGLHQLLAAIGIGGGSGSLGNVGPGAVALVVTLWAVYKAASPRAAWWTGVVGALVYAGAGGIWTRVADVLSHVVTGLAA